ncbi:MAG TPA: hypothetical protein VNU47_02850 [Candidatus Paceibacterota bacterium]|nr:hypothetical protein [Candidatus Paceibacterota bacterium]
MEKQYKIVVYVPLRSADEVRAALGKAGAGVIGDYTHCTFSSRGIGRFLPGQGAHPTIGNVGELTEVEEERIETVCRAGVLTDVLKAIKQVHPYEEPAIDVYPIEIV